MGSVACRRAPGLASAKQAGLCLARSVPFGKYRRRMRWGSRWCRAARRHEGRRSTPAGRRRSATACCAISAAWSQVRDRRSCSRSVVIAVAIASPRARRRDRERGTNLRPRPTPADHRRVQQIANPVLRLAPRDGHDRTASYVQLRSHQRQGLVAHRGLTQLDTFHSQPSLHQKPVSSTTSSRPSKQSGRRPPA